ncbi:MAG TPA: hypothetical protein EYO01_00465 [Phycisphaerales bacterium]|nr:hypothetical protein [Phycisphaerales bacterium]
MKNFTTCICILGLSGTAFGVVVMDQIGPDDGTGIGANITGCQNFEAAYDIYDIATMDNFTGAGENINMVEMVLNGWNGFVDPSGVMGYNSNLHSAPAAAAISLVGDIATSYADAASSTISATWMGAGFNVSMPSSMAAAVGMNWVSMIPDNDFATGGQTGVADGLVGDGVLGWQANPGGGFGMPGNMAEMLGEAAYRIHSGAAADPCTLPLPAVCAADVDGDGAVAVSDVLAIIGAWGSCGDGTFRPVGDIAPMPNGDCCVNVGDVLAVVGSWGMDCNVYGGCCLGDGSCATDTSANCAANGGVYFGDNTTCADGTCAAAACCITAQCSMLTGDACAAMGGTAHPNDTCVTWDCSVATPGDLCADALVAIDGANPFDTTAMTAGADIPTCAADAGAFGWTAPTNDVWLSWTATYTDDYAIDTCDAASFDTSVVVYDACGGAAVACSGDGTALTGCQIFYSDLVLAATAGSTYYIRIGGFSAADMGTGTLNINIVPPPVPGACCMQDGNCLDGLDDVSCAAFGGVFAGEATLCSDLPCAAAGGDTCDTAVVAVDGPNAYDNTLFVDSGFGLPDDTMCAGTYLDWGTSPDAWMVYTPAGNGTVSVSLCDAAGVDTSLVLYSGLACTALTQVACNGDSTVETGCQAYYSGVYDLPVDGASDLYIRIGSWQGTSVGAGTCTITFTPGDVVGACCLADGSCVDLNSASCLQAGGSFDSTQMCATASCPQPFAGCPAGAEYECDACAIDGSDSALDCNAGLNGVPPVYQAITLGVPVCGTGAVFLDITGATYRDLDWFTNATLNAGGNFTISAGTSGMDLLFGVVDNALGAFVAAYVVPGGFSGSADFLALPAGDYSILVGANEWNTAWTCASGLVDYSVQLD